MRALEPLSAHLDAPRWHAASLALLCLLDQAAKHMLVLKDALAADLLAFLEDVEAVGRGVPALPALGSSGGEQRQQTICGQARTLRAQLLRMTD